MKIAALASVLALACSTALAAPYGSGSADRDAAAGRTQSAAAATDTRSDGAKDEGLIDKTKRALQRIGDKMRNATNRTENAERKSTDRDADEQAAKKDTRSMGAAGSDKQDASRQRRMDDAYRDSKSKQQ